MWLVCAKLRFYLCCSFPCRFSGATTFIGGPHQQRLCIDGAARACMEPAATQTACSVHLHFLFRFPFPCRPPTHECRRILGVRDDNQRRTNKQTNKAASKQASQEASNRYCRSQHSTLSFQPPCVCAIGERHGTDNALREGGRGELPDDGCGGVVTVYRKRSRRAVAKQRGHNVANQESRNHDVCMPSKQRKRSCTVLPYCTVRVY